MQFDSMAIARLQDQAVVWGPRVLIALLIIVVTWIVARAVKWALLKSIDKSPTLRKHHGGPPGETVGHQLGTIAQLVIWLVGIMAALQFLGVGQILEPINQLTSRIFEFLPRLLGAGLIFFIGLIVARIVRKLVETILAATDLDGLMARAGVGSGSSRPPSSASVSPSSATVASSGTLAKAAGVIVFALIIIPVAIAALQVLGVEAISVPAINMLNEVLAAIPRVLSAALWLGIAYVVGRFVKSLIESILPPTGFDQAIASAEVLPATTNASRIVANVAFTAIMLTAAIEAAKQLGGDTIAVFLAQVTALGGKVIFGTLIIVAGVFLARIIAKLVGSASGSGGYAQTIVQYAIIALFTAIGLTFMGLADSIVMLAFGLILGSAAVAAALAFGLGGREAAGKLLKKYADRETIGGKPGIAVASPQADRAPTE
jgi:Conserved TM helix